MILEIKAKYACDDCGTEFFVPLDPAYEAPANWPVIAVADDAIRGGQGYEDAHENPTGKSGSVGPDGRHYCSRCTDRNDARATARGAV